jgi:hypothetical protein
VTAPLRVTGTIAAGSARRAVDLVLGGTAPAERRVVLESGGPATLRLRVTLPDPVDILPAPGELAAARRPLLTLQAALGAAAVASAYRRYLDSPDRFGAAEATYVYRTVARPPAAAAPARRHERGGLEWTVLAWAAAAAALAGAAVLWARS